MAALLLCGLSGHARASPPFAVALDLTPLTAADHRRIDGAGLERQTVLRLVQEGFAVVSPRAQPDLVVRVSREAEELRLSWQDGAGGDERRVALAAGPGLPELHWEAAQKVVELARSWRAAAVRPSAPPLPAPSWQIGASFGGRIRAEALDPLAAAAVVRAGAPFSIEALAQASWSRAPSLSIQELEILAGPARRWALGRAGSLHLALLAGVGAHHSASTLPGDPHPSVLQIGAALSGEAALSFRLAGPLELGIRVAPGLSAPEVVHRSGETILWRRGIFRLDGAILAAFRIE